MPGAWSLGKGQSAPKRVHGKTTTESVEEDKMNENLTNQEKAKGKTKENVYTDEDHYYEQEDEEQRLWKEYERERRQQQKQCREEHWKAVRALIELEKNGYMKSRRLNSHTRATIR
ncbi:hypothetical protein Tco_1457365 [Tanacetum coccineum]